MRGIIKERLFTPGPTPLRIEAQARTLAATLHHRTEAFRQLVRETLENLRYFFNTQNDVLIFTSSGTGAMEGALANLLSPGERVLVGTAGEFGFPGDRESTRLNSSHHQKSYAVFCLEKKKNQIGSHDLPLSSLELITS